MRRPRRLLLALFVAVALHAETPSSIPIAAARQRAPGESVTVMGLVSVPSARFRSSSGDAGFALQDQTGGIWISTKRDLRLRTGERVVVTGILGENAKNLQIVTEAATRLPGRELRVATGQVGAPVLGFLITVEGKIVEIVSDEPYGTKVFIDDGSGRAQVFVNASTGIEVRWKAGQTLRATGFASQYETAYEVEPRSRADVRISPN